MPPGAEGRTRAAPPFCYFTIRPGRSPDSTAGVDFWNSSCCCLFSTVFRWNFIDLCFSSTLLPETVDSRVKRTLIRTRDNVSNDRHGGTGWEKGVGSISIELLSRRLSRGSRSIPEIFNVKRDERRLGIVNFRYFISAELSSYREPFDRLQIFMSFMSDQTNDIVGHWIAKW